MKKLLSALFSILASFWILSIFSSWILAKAPEPIGSRSDLFIEGAQTTLLLTLGAGALGIALGLWWGLAKGVTSETKKGKILAKVFLSFPASFFVWILRGTPLLVQILFAYYALPAIFPWLQLSEFSASLIALAFNVGAYNAEVFRAGIEAVSKGQKEAARSLGLSQGQTMFFVVMPQAFKIVTPPLINNIVALLKDSSLASTVGLLELSLAGSRVTSETFLPIPVLTTVAILYLTYTTLITAIASYYEKSWQKEPL